MTRLWLRRACLPLAVTAALAFVPVSAQDVKLTADDAAIIRAAIDGVRPQMRLEQWGGSTTLLIFDRTIAACPNDKSLPRERDCLKQDDDVFGEIAKLSTVFKSLTRFTS